MPDWIKNLIFGIVLTGGGAIIGCAAGKILGRRYNENLNDNENFTFFDLNEGAAQNININDIGSIKTVVGSIKAHGEMIVIDNEKFLAKNHSDKIQPVHQLAIDQ